MQAYFRNGDIYQTRVDGNAILVNFPMEKDSTFLYQNYCEAAKLRVDVRDKKMQRFWAGPSPIAKNLSHPEWRFPNIIVWQTLRGLTISDQEDLKIFSNGVRKVLKRA